MRRGLVRWLREAAKAVTCVGQRVGYLANRTPSQCTTTHLICSLCAKSHRNRHSHKRKRKSSPDSSRQSPIRSCWRRRGTLSSTFTPSVAATCSMTKVSFCKGGRFLPSLCSSPVLCGCVEDSNQIGHPVCTVPMQSFFGSRRLLGCSQSIMWKVHIGTTSRKSPSGMRFMYLCMIDTGDFPGVPP